MIYIKNDNNNPKPEEEGDILKMNVRINPTNPRLGNIRLPKLCFFSLSVFNQGEEGTSWYIILKGSVNVVIYGKVGIPPVYF